MTPKEEWGASLLEFEQAHERTVFEVAAWRGLQSSRKTLSQSMISHGMARNEAQGAFDGMMADHTERFTTALKEESTRWQSCLNLLRAYPDVLTSND